jgi:hypothetical protein
MESTHHWEPWNKGKLVGQKPPLKPKDIWAIRIQLQNAHQVRDLAMFNLAIDSKLRGCDLVNLHVRDITHGNQVLARAMVVQRKTQRPVQFELTEPTRAAVTAWIEKAKLKPEQCLFPSRLTKSPHVSTRQYARIVHHWVAAIGLDPTVYAASYPGSSTQTRSPISVSASVAIETPACAPGAMMIWCALQTTPRAAPRYSAKASRSGRKPCGSP